LSRISFASCIGYVLAMADADNKISTFNENNNLMV
jgi:hypothetical protein